MVGELQADERGSIMVGELQADIKRTKNGEALPGTLALEDRIAQMHSQAMSDDLSDEAQEALALLVTGGGK
jgi:hypothetical protein